MSEPTKLLRCAIYTRKSSDEGLEQEFNSLDAQREASEAYIKSQTHEGWLPIASRYDDGGFSGGSMERPALRRLLDDIGLGKIDTVVVYKIDRLTRSLADFARIVELFDKHQVSFVSVTQSFNTTSSMGRLTLNVLLSFAQFEREVTGERIRDKIAASKAKGMWMGGVLPLGYDLPSGKARTLTLNESEAETVRLIFKQYLKLGSVPDLIDWLTKRRIVSKRRQSGTGKEVGGVPFARGALYHLLRNETYLGYIRHKGVLHPAAHPAIVDQTLFKKVQQALGAGRTRHANRRNPVARAPLTGRLFDASGSPMSPVSAHGRHGKRYTYYVSSVLQRGGRLAQSLPSASEQLRDDIVRRIPAKGIESQIEAMLTRLFPGATVDVLTLPSRIEIHGSTAHLTLPRSACTGLQARVTGEERIEDDVADPSSLRLVSALRMRNRRGRTEIRSSPVATIRRDPVLISALQRAHEMIELDARHLPVCQKAPETQYGRRLIRLAFLAPDLQRAIINGTQPADLTLEHLVSLPLPADWSAQRQLFAHV